MIHRPQGGRHSRAFNIRRSVSIGEEAPVTGDRFLVEGGHPLRGTVTPAGNKNEALPVLAACLLARARSSSTTCRASGT